MIEPDARSPVDGRTARRERGRVAVIEAAFRILSEGGPATADALAKEAGISVSSLYRYVEGLDDLFRQAAEHFAVTHRDLFDAMPTAGADRANRIVEFVDLRVHSAVTLEPWIRHVEAYAVSEVDLSPVISGLRARSTAQVGRYFRPELSRLTPARRADLEGNLDIITSTAAARMMRTVHGRSANQIKRAWRSALTALLDHDDRRR